MQTSQNRAFREVTKTGYSNVTYYINEPDRNYPEDRSQDRHIAAIVSLEENRVVEIRLPDFDLCRGIPARALWALQKLLPALMAEGYVLSYKSTMLEGLTNIETKRIPLKGAWKA